jgi:hypothetical protein
MNMRDLITLCETYSEATMSPEQLRGMAAYWQDAIQDAKADDFDWHFDPAFPISNINGGDDTLNPEGWATWMKDEIQMWAEEGEPDRYDDMFGHRIEEPVVLHLDKSGHGHIWDGCHRTGACAMQGVATIPAIVGVPREPFAV